MSLRRQNLLRHVRFLLESLAVLAFLSCHGVAEEPEITYRRDILPLLSDRCFTCHGPDSATREAGLRLDQRGVAVAELGSGVTAIVPGDAAASALVERIESTDEAIQMPPVDSGKTLSAREKALLRRWVEQGAEYEPHWAFVAPERPPVPNVAGTEHVANPIDAFVIERLKSEALEHSPQATKERLIRRVYFDLIGLPPALKEIDAFLADDSPEAFQRVVDRLMESPHYGERMAAEWLDGARYADTNGYQNDFARRMWPWRDWVIAAYNAHMPYDQFVTEQLAGDLLPNPTLQQRIATGFNRNNRTVTEAGSIEEEWLVENVVDRVETTSTVFLGLTIGCARCHDHKFDPITHQEFYEFFAFFNNVNEKGVYTEQRGNVPPLVQVVTPERAKKLSEFDQKIAKLNAQLTEQMDLIDAHRQPWLDSLAQTAGQPEPAAAVSVPLRNDATAHVAITNSAVPPDSRSAAPEWRAELFGEIAVFTGQQHLAYSQLDFPPSDRPFSWAVWVKPTGAGAILSRMDSAAGERGADLFLFEDGKVGVHIIDVWPANAMKVLTGGPLPREKWSHVIATYDGSRNAAGISLYVNGKKQEVTAEVDQLTGTFLTDQPFRIGKRSGNSPLHAAVADVRLYHHALSEAESQRVFDGSLGRGLEVINIGQLDDTLRAKFDELLLAHSKDPAVIKIAETKRAVERAQQRKTKYEAAIPTVMVMEDRAEPRETYLLRRGQYDLPEKSQRLSPGVPAALPPLPADAPRNRLGLAHWVTSPENPLTARVAVNRRWQRFFGLGLVKSPNNFGVQSEPPSHPELLDWLATELIRSDWSLQHIERLIVSSRTYQQQSEAPPALYKRDPENRLLARGPRHRLSAEAIRDNALSVSSLLVSKIGGPSVRPYQPAGLWTELAGGFRKDYVQSHGDDLYRRSLYTYRKRTVPHPTTSTFDAPSWEICLVKRDRTNTPLQALALLNDVTYVEAARKLAERMLKDGGGSLDERLTFAFRLATGRTPTPPELSTLRISLEKYAARYRESPAAAEELLSHGESSRDKSLDNIELAAHTAVASVILNLDETVSKN
jgi:Protein of unknown function (DUF1553)/Protein of unknown function (DUF1549)/Concanavalin A-like lectin/glucanases superfamily/Planctomycete cytochrome C